MTPRDVAYRLQVPECTILSLLSTGQLRGVRGHTGWCIAEKNLEAFLESSANFNSAGWRPRLRLIKDNTVNIVPIPRQGLNHIDLRVIEFACRFLGWDLETAETPEDETFAVLLSPAFEDVVFILTKQAQAYVLSEFPAQVVRPRVYAKGSLHAIFEVLPEMHTYHRSA